MTTPTARRVSYIPLLLSVAAVAVAGWIWLTRPGVLLAGHPAYPVAVTLVGAGVLVLLPLALRRAGSGRVGGAGPRWLRLLGRGVLILGAVLVLGVLVWLRPFRASPEALRLLAGTDAVTVTDSPTRLTLTPSGEEVTGGLIFQPGARVDPRAYLPLLSDTAAQGHLVVVVEQPFGIGFTALGAPAGVIEDHPQIEHWTVGGHSLGGVVASRYAEDHPDEIDGLLLWASYPLGDLRGRDDLTVSTIYGSEDGLAPPADVEAGLADLPPDTPAVEIEGAVHSYFGDYGEQPGDGRPGVSREAAQTQIVRATADLLDSVENG
ncbi:alpha/beta hydrolase [Serinicoccus marinus]|uniref:alpha/beta hydrolase n=1 Tax=Serinicoccus marinus TaxID=247333 RepID=UPI00249044F7|nr:alpha/beta hydrolase [Serinicoccus marinus]